MSAVLALAACSETTAPEEGTPPPPAEVTYSATATLKSVTALSICEEAFTDFDGGEFIWSIAVTWPDGTVSTLSQTANYPSAAAHVKLVQGQARTTTGIATKTITGNTGAINVTVRASEVDFDLFGGNPSRDGRMNDRSATGVHAFSASGWPQGSFTATVAPEPACRFQVLYDLIVVRN